MAAFGTPEELRLRVFYDAPTPYRTKSLAPIVLPTPSPLRRASPHLRAGQTHGLLLRASRGARDRRGLCAQPQNGKRARAVNNGGVGGR